ncbi:S-layer homology domain-containing protein [Agathobaculum butyriciproducens]|uniref:S-layer homology domain-containing protein n=1 Tax=Agathobaculum butyriciproducens TaxID=1628085 RepID=UPI003AF12047
MKKRLLSAFLAVMMVLTMAPVAFAAEEAGNGDTLKKLFTDVKAGESGSGNVTVTIDKDYNLTGYNWTALTVDGYNGAGIVTVEGNNHTITGLNTSLFAGGFAGTSGIVIKDLTLDNVSIEDTTNEQGIGAFINNVDSMPKIELNNCHLTDSTITSTGGARVGGLIGWTSGYNKKDDGPVDTYITVTNCSVENTKITAKGSVGGIIGHAGANPATYHTFTNNTVTGCTLHSTDDGGWRVGVVVGTVNVGEVALNNTTESGNTVTQTGKTAPAGQSNLYGRFVPGTTGKLVIDGTAVFDSSIVAVVDNKGYKTLADAVAAAQGGATVKLLKDVTEDVVIPAGKTITLDLNGKKLTNIRDNTITNHGKIEIIDKTGKGVVDNITNAKTAITNDGTVVLRGGTYTRSQEAGKDKDNGGGNSYYTILNDNGGSLTIYDGVTVYNKGHFSSMIRNGGTAGAESKLYINGGTFSGGINTVKNDESGYLNISGGDFSNTTQFVVMNWHKAEISGDATFAVNDTAEAVLFTSSYGGAATTKGELTISGGYFKTATDTQDMIRDAYDANNKGTAYVSGGYFNKRFSGDFCATGLTVIDNDDKIYKYTVGTVEVKDENEIKTGTQEGDTQADVSAIAADKQDAAREVGESVTPTKLADTTPITPDDKAQALTELVKKNKVTLDTNGKIPENTTVTVVKETYLDVTVTGYDTANSTVSMDIAPKYNLIAVAKTGDNQTAQVTLKSAQDAKVGSTEVEVTLPEAFKGKKVYINHNNGANLYVATADKTTGKVKFTTNGFSPFTFALTNPDVVAEVNGNAYKSLKEAIDVAQTGATIVLQKDCTEKVTVAGKSLTINRNGKTFNEANVKVGSNCTKEVKNDTIVVTYTKPSSGSSGGSSSGKTTYKVTTSAVNNGGVNASPSNAEKGAAITITLSPDKGYKLDKLTVTDGSGKTVSTVKKSDTVYTFTMPASAVKVGVSYVKDTETPSETKFNDVSANDWFASAVDYVTGKGMMNGTADNTFSPKANTTRGMVVTVLYRLENQPSTSAASFTDVASGAYYANAVAWANANGIVSGYGSGKFGPNDKVTREQLAAILYRYAQYKKYDVSVGEDTNILSYDDAQSISSYAIPAIQWACGAGVVTGKSGSKLDPKGNATRAEVAAMLMRFCENVK